MSVNQSRRSSAGEEVAAVDGEKNSIAGSHDGISWTAEEEARVVRKIDWHLLPGLTLLYLLSFLDRANSALGLECVADPAVGNAKLLGLLTDIGITDAADYNTSLALYFLRVTPLESLSLTVQGLCGHCLLNTAETSDVLFEVPAQAVLKRLNPKLWLPLLTVAWGVTATLQARRRRRAIRADEAGPCVEPLWVLCGAVRLLVCP